MGQVTIISISKNREDSNIPKWRRKLPHKLYCSYLLKKLPINIEESFIYGEKCTKIRLPFIEQDIEQMDKEFIKEFIQYLIEKEEIEYPYLNHKLQEFKGYFCKAYNWFLFYLLFPEVVKMILEKKKIKMYQIHPLLIDSGDRKIEYILDCMISDLNHLVIQTHRKSYFSDFINAVYDTYGLVVELIDQEERKLNYYDFIIDMNQDYYKEYIFFKKAIPIIDFSFCIEKDQYLSHRRVDLERYDSGSITMRQEQVDEELLALLLVSQNRKIQQFMKDQTGLTKEEGKEYIKTYNLVLHQCDPKQI